MLLHFGMSISVSLCSMFRRRGAQTRTQKKIHNSVTTTRFTTQHHFLRAQVSSLSALGDHFRWGSRGLRVRLHRGAPVAPTPPSSRRSPPFRSGGSHRSTERGLSQRGVPKCGVTVPVRSLLRPDRASRRRCQAPPFGALLVLGARRPSPRPCRAGAGATVTPTHAPDTRATPTRVHA